MRLSRTSLCIAAVVLVAVGFGASIAFGSRSSDQRIAYQEPSTQQINYGISQLLAGHLGEERFPLRLFNPGFETHVASILAYTAPQIGDPGNGEDFEADDEGQPVFPQQFLGCLNVRVPPHGAFALEDDFLTDELPVNNSNTILNVSEDGPRPAINPARARVYVEILSAPEKPVGLYIKSASSSQRTFFLGRLADGFGLAASNGDEGTQIHKLNSVLFNLPRDTDAFPNQRQAAIDCMCEASTAVGDRWLWKDWGLVCD